MTSFQTNDDEFGKWHYRRDPTHVVFFREETFRLVAERRGWTCEFPAKDVALMRKPDEVDAHDAAAAARQRGVEGAEGVTEVGSKLGGD